MIYTVTSLTLIYVLTATIAAVAALFAWNRRRANGGIWLFLMMLAATQWCVADAFQVSASTLQGHIIWAKVSYIGSTSIAVFLLLFTIEYSGGRRLLKPALITALFVPSALSVIAAFANESLPLTWTAVTWSAQHNGIVVFQHGPFYWAITVYTLIVTVAASVVIVRFALRSWVDHRVQAVALVGCATITWAAAVLYNTNQTLLPGVDVNVTFALSGAVLTYVMLRHGLLDLVPLARGAFIEEMADGVLVLDDRSRIVDANPSAAHLLSLRRDELCGADLDDALAQVPELLLAIHAASVRRDVAPASIVIAGSHIDVQVTPVRATARAAGRLVVLRDVSRYKSIERQLQESNASLHTRVDDVTKLQVELQEVAIRDSLTGLHNRRFMTETLDREFLRARREGYPVCVVMIDIDYFKDINDGHGHAAGDSILVNLGVLLATRTRGGDIACRYGGDEFVVVMPNTTPEDAVSRAEAWRDEFAQNAPGWLGTNDPVTLSCGVALTTENGLSPGEVFAAADTAVYAAKDAGRNTVCRAPEQVI